MNHNQMEFKFTKKAKWLSVNGCSIYSSLSESTIRRSIAKGYLKANKVGGKWLIKDLWLETFLCQ